MLPAGRGLGGDALHRHDRGSVGGRAVPGRAGRTGGGGVLCRGVRARDREVHRRRPPLPRRCPRGPAPAPAPVDPRGHRAAAGLEGPPDRAGHLVAADGGRGVRGPSTSPRSRPGCRSRSWSGPSRKPGSGSTRPMPKPAGWRPRRVAGSTSTPTRCPSAAPWRSPAPWTWPTPSTSTGPSQPAPRPWPTWAAASRSTYAAPWPPGSWPATRTPSTCRRRRGRWCCTCTPTAARSPGWRTPGRCTPWTRSATGAATRTPPCTCGR